MPVTIPFIFVGGPGNKAKASEVNANFAALVAKFAPGITAADIASGAGIRGSGATNQLSVVPGERVGTLSIEDEAITELKLASDAGAGSDALRAVSGDHIKSVTEAHLDRIIPAAAFGKDKLKITDQAVAFSITGVGAVDSTTFVNLAALGIPVPTATAIIIGMYFQNITITTGSLLKGLMIERIVTGANYQVRVYISSSGGATVTGNVIVVSMSLN